MNEKPVRTLWIEGALVLFATCAGWLIATMNVARLPVYLPMTDTWASHPEPHEMRIDWYARAAIALVCGLVGRLCAGVLSRTKHGNSHARMYLAVAAGLLLWTLGFTILWVLQNTLRPAG